ncbi:hypothetical protein C8R41DRAFT_984707 [Lentinula lateritia]|uniref:Uncharacterized protein n=1 Tax=Lentinula lateritia TaxID=40482 RepID=A0ABQ8V0N3_9AGAR|nr:hypothetical protein C8R41DRAFT_984707 [Lentinula lateritia]
MDVRQSKDTGWRALSSTESTPSSIDQLLGVLSQLDSALKISVDRNAFDKLNHIYADEQANVETALHNHQMTHRNTIVVKPKFDTFGVPHSMKDLDFWTELDGTPYHSSDGTVVKFWASFTPVAIINVGASPIGSTVLHDRAPARLFLGYTYIREGEGELDQWTRQDGSHRSMEGRVGYLKFRKQFYELEIEIDEEAFSKLNYIFIDNHVVTKVEDEIRSHQMNLESTIVVQPQKDKLNGMDTMKNLEFETEPGFHRSQDGTLLKFYVSSVTPVKKATSKKVADWRAWKGGILNLPSGL